MWNSATRRKLVGALLVSATAVGILGSVAHLRGQTASIGEWSAVFDMPLVAVHSTPMHTGEVLTFDAWEYGGTPSARLWNPVTGNYTVVPNTFAQLFCAGHTLLADGRLMTIGGHNGGGIGVRDVTMFDPIAQQWSQLPSMIYPRWYPTAIELLDGRVVALGGATQRPAMAEVPEVYTPATNAWVALTNATKDVGEYPRAFVGPDGRLVVAEEGPASLTWFFDVDAQVWTPIGQSPAASGTAVMYRPGKILMAGGGSAGGSDPVVPTAGILDLNQTTPAWRTIAPMAFGRAQHNLVILPDGKVLVVGGSTEVSLISTSGVLAAEMWDPTTEAWTTMASMATPRMYHSTVGLMPDGRVFAAGGGRLPPAIDHLNGEIYTPPYLLTGGSRPVITSAPDTVAYDTPFTIQTPDPASVARITMVRSGSITHTLNLEQRFVELSFTRGAGTLSTTSPANMGVTTPGYYLLFLLDANGVPSVGRYIKLDGAPAGPTLSIDDQTVVEGTGGTTTATFTVTLANPGSQTVTVDYTTVDGSATAGSDYTAVTGTLTFPAGVTQRTIPVSINPDPTIEPNETFTIKLTNATNATIVDGFGVGAIIDDDAPIVPSISINDVTVTEGTGGSTAANFSVTLSTAVSQTVTVQFATADGTASAGSDYTPASGTLTFAPGVTTLPVVVPITADDVPESSETFTVTLSGAANATIARDTGVGTIVDDDSVTAVFRIQSGADDANEADGSFDAGSSAVWLGTGATTMSYAGLRFVNVTIPRGATIVSADLQVQASTTQWQAVQAAVGGEASGNSAPFSDANRPSQRALVTPVMSHASDAQWLENTWNSFTVMGGHPGHDPGIAPIVQAIVNRPDWSPGNALSLIVQGTGNPWGRKFINSVEANPTHAEDSPIQPARLVVSYAGGQSGPPTPTLTINDVTVTEGTGGTTTASFTVSLTAGTTTPVTVQFATADGTATAPADYTAVNGTLNFAPGVTMQTIAVPIAPDVAIESNETFNVVLSNATNAVIADDTGVGTIVDDDTPVIPTISIDDVTVTEGTGGTTTATFTATLSSATTSTVTVHYATADGTATAPGDYTAGSGTLTFAPGTTTQTIAVPIVPDSLLESTETFNVVLSNPANATIAKGTGVGTIQDDDSGVVTATFPIAAGTDDVNEDGTSFAGDGSSLWLGSGSSTTGSYTGLRFAGVSIPAGASIVSAHLDVHVASNQWNGMSFDMTAEAAGDSAPFSASSRPSQRTLLTPRVSHASNSQWLANTWYSLDDIAPVVQAVVNQGGWSAGHALSLILHGTGGAWSRKFADAFETGSTVAPRLVITYVGGPPPPPSLSINDVTVTEGTGGTTMATFTVTLSRTTDQAVTVQYATANGSATAPDDYTAASGTLTFAPGTTTQTIPISIVPDSLAEPIETFSVILSNPTNASIADGTGIGSITDDDGGLVDATFTIVTGADDANEDGASFDAGGSSVWLGNGSSAASSYTGLRFAGVTIPRGATILSAHLEVHAASTQWNSISFDIGAEAAADSAPLSAASPPSLRTLLAPHVSHSSNVQWLAGTWYTLDDLTALVQAAVNQSGWTSGHALTLVMHGTGGSWGRKFADSFETAGAVQAPRLVVSYSLAP